MSQERVSGFPEKGLTSGEVWGTSGEVWGTSGEPVFTSGEPVFTVKFHSERTSGKSPKKLPGKFGELPGKPGDFPEARGSLTPSQRLAKLISKKFRDSACEACQRKSPQESLDANVLRMSLSQCSALLTALFY